MPNFLIVRLQTKIYCFSDIKEENTAPATSRAKRSPIDHSRDRKIMPRAPAAQSGQKSTFHSAHATRGHLEVLHTRFHDRATSNLGD